MANQKRTTSRKRSPIKPKVVMTTASGIRIAEPAKSKKRRASKPKVVTVIGQTDDVIIGQATGFANFLREYGVVGLAVGFIAGQQANAVIKQLVASFVDPLVKIWFGQNLSDRKGYFHHGATPVEIPWGQFVYTLIDFFIILIAVYAVIKIFKLDRLKKVDPAAATVAVPVATPEHVIVTEPKKK